MTEVKRLLVGPRSTDEIREAARLARTAIESCTSPGRFSERLLEFVEHDMGPICGVRFELVDEMSMPDYASCDGDTLWLRADVYCDVIISGGRALFTLAHELGHVVMHKGALRFANTNPEKVTLYRADTHARFRDPEWQADTFGSELLMPRDYIRELSRTLGFGPALIDRLQSETNVSRQAAEVAVNKTRRQTAGT